MKFRNNDIVLTFGDSINVTTSAGVEHTIYVGNDDNLVIDISGITDTGNLAVSGNANIQGNTLLNGNLIVNGGAYIPSLSAGHVSIPLSASDITIAHIHNATHPVIDNLQEMLNYTASTGYTGGGLISASNGSVDITSGTGFIRTADVHNAPLQSFTFAASAGWPLSAGEYKWFFVDYNGGDPRLIAKTGDYSTNEHTEFNIGAAVNENSLITIFSSPDNINNAAMHTIERFRHTEPLLRAEGIIIGEIPTRVVTITSGEIYDKLNEFATPAVSSSTNTYGILAYVRDGAGGWTMTSGATQWPNTQYDGGAGSLVTMTDNYYSVLYFYGDADFNLNMVYDTVEYLKSADAETSQPISPEDLPDKLKYMSLHIGRIVFQKSASAATEVDSAFDFTAYQNQQGADHGNLTGLLDDDHPQYLILDGTRGTQSVSGDLGFYGVLTVSGSLKGDGPASRLLIDDDVLITGSLNVSGGIGNVFNYIDFNPDVVTDPPSAEGRTWWNFSEHTLNVHTDSETVIQVGQETVVRVYNPTSAAIPNGAPVWTNGSAPDTHRPRVLLASALSYVEAHLIVGMTTQEIPPSGEGFTTEFGVVRGLDMSAYAEGAILYISPSAGELTNVKPLPPNHATVIALVLNNDAVSGSVLCKPFVGEETWSLHNVSDSFPSATGQIMVWDNAAQYYRVPANPTLNDVTVTGLTDTGNLNVSGSAVVLTDMAVGTDSPGGFIFRVSGSTRVDNTYAVNGTVGTPSYTFVDYTSTGMYSPVANALGLAANGSKIVHINTTGVFISGGLYLQSSGSWDTIQSDNTNSDFRIRQYVSAPLPQADIIQGLNGNVILYAVGGGGLPEWRLKTNSTGIDVSGGITTDRAGITIGSTVIREQTAGDLYINFGVDQTAVHTISAAGNFHIVDSWTSGLNPHTGNLKLDGSLTVGDGSTLGTGAIDMYPAGAAGAIITSRTDGETFFIRGNDSGSIARSILVGDPDGTTTLYTSGSPRLGTTAYGAETTGRHYVTGNLVVSGAIKTPGTSLYVGTAHITEANDELTIDKPTNVVGDLNVTGTINVTGGIVDQGAAPHAELYLDLFGLTIATSASNTGSSTTGAVSSTYVIDGNYLRIEDANGAAYVANFYIEGMTGNPRKWNVTGRYEGGSHNVYARAYNWTNHTWERFTADAKDMPSQVFDSNYEFDFTDTAGELSSPPSGYVSAGECRVQMWHSSNGTLGHYLYFDAISIVQEQLSLTDSAQHYGLTSPYLSAGHFNNCTVSAAIGGFVIEEAGHYLCHLTTSFQGSPAVVYAGELWKNNTELLAGSSPNKIAFFRKLGIAGDVGSASFIGFVQCDAGDSITAKIKGNEPNSWISFASYNFTIHKI